MFSIFRKLLFVSSSILCISAILISADNSILNKELTNLKGKKINVADYNRDSILILSFWATWCVPCKKELPHLNKIYKEYKDKGVNVVTINQDTPRSLSKVKSFIRSKRYNFPVLLDPDKSFFQRFNASGIPLLIIFDKNGNMIYNHLGYMPGDEKRVKQIIQELLSQK